MHSSLAPLRVALFASIGFFSAGCADDEGFVAGGGGAGGGNPAAGGTAAGGAGGANAGAGGAGAGGVKNTFTLGTCVDPLPIVGLNGADTGFVYCADGGVDRVVAQTIPLAGSSVGDCSSDADCLENEACAFAPADQAGSKCIPARCRSSADCASGRCGRAGTNNESFGCIQTYELDCRTAQDACVVSCTGVDSYCAGGPLGFGCATVSPTCGRPLLVDGSARVATRALRRDWTAEIDIDTSDLTRSEQSSLADHWLAIASLEHASIASFARFSMQLLGLGAPAELVDEATAAMRDEVEHARIAYAIAGQYANSPVGPAPLDLTGVLVAMDESEIVETLAREGCVGETLGAAEARVAAAGVGDRMLKSALVRIADDETRHAALAWKTLAWMLAGGDHELRATAARALDDAMNEIARMRLPDALGTPAHGLLSSNELRSLRRDALADVIAPCVAHVSAA